VGGSISLLAVYMHSFVVEILVRGAKIVTPVSSETHH
jgi:hypothetical protein